MQKVKIVSVIVLGLVIIGGYIKWLDVKDAKEAKVYAALDKCMLATYGETAAGYYEQHGVIPDCTATTSGK